jgi:methyltransferase-like protein/SAM-dependent methyltransferase
MSTDASASLSENPTSYDQTPYPSAAFSQTHPSRLAAMAQLFGVASTAPSKARVLELGCADGSNLLPLAEQLPEASFVGVDSSKVAIAAGLKTIAAAGLKNIELRQQDFLEFPADAGKFDYIIAHGVYSWVPDAVREKLFAICAEHLAENGVAYISYNAHPGWNLRRALRDMMLYHTRTFPDPKAKVQQARALIGFLAESVPTENNVYGTLLKNELSHLNNYPDGFLLHDILGEENTPVYFHEFIAHAAKHGFQYLAESSISEMLAGNFPEKVQKTLGQLNNQIVAQEQYMDFLRNRAFRQTLLCRANIRLQRNLTPQAMAQFAFRSLLGGASGPVELVPGVSVSFTTASGAQITSSDAFVKAVLWTLSETRGISAIGYRDLLETARSRSRPFLGETDANRDQMDEATLQTNLLNLLTKGLVELYAEPLRVRTDVPEKPQVSAVARYEALHARLVTNRIHKAVPADVVSRYILAACDGTKTRDEIVADLAARAANGELQVNEGSVKVTDPAKLRKLLTPKVDAALAAIANGGFFAA